MENALAQAPSVANTTGQNPIFSTDVAAEPAEAPAEQCKPCCLLSFNERLVFHKNLGLYSPYVRPAYPTFRH